MNKTGYMNALRAALEGLPADIVEQCLWEYEGKFAEGLAAGKTEEEIACGLPAPRLVAAQKTARSHYRNLRQHITLANFFSLIVALIGLGIFNLFMLIPALAYFCLLMSSFVVALTLYGAGIVIGGAAVSGVTHFNLEVPAAHRYIVLDDDEITAFADGHQIKVDISRDGIFIDQDSGAASAQIAPNSVHIDFSNHVGFGQIWTGIGLVLASIVLMLVNLLLVKLSFTGFARYLRWNISMLKVHHQPA